MTDKEKVYNKKHFSINARDSVINHLLWMASFILLCYSFLEKATSHQTGNYGYHFPQDDPHCQVFQVHHGSKTNLVLRIDAMAGSVEHDIHNKKNTDRLGVNVGGYSHLNKEIILYIAREVILS